MAKPKRPASPLIQCEMILTRFSTRECDFDNLVASFKPVVDGLKDAGVILDDSSKVIVRREYRHRPAKPKQGKVRIEVIEVKESPHG